VSPDQGRRGTREGPGKGTPSGAAGAVAARRALLAFGVLFVVLFVVVAIAEGLGDPSIPSGDVAFVEGAPGDLDEISQEQFDHALELTAIQGGEKKPPKPGDPKYEEMKESTLGTLFEAVWLQGLAAEMGIEVSQKEINDELRKVKKESFKSEAEFQKFLKESGYSLGDAYERIKLQALTQAIVAQLGEEAPKPSQGELEDYYEAVKNTQFTTKATREFRVVTNEDRQKIDAAFEALSKDNSAKNWKEVAKRYSSDPNTKGKGGLQPAIAEGTIEEPLNAAVFNAPEGRLEGPVKNKFGYSIFEVVNENPESVQDFKTVEKQIESTLANELEQESIANFGSSFNAEWTARTFCADGYVIERCANYESSGHPATAPEGCYEADPKTPVEACPAPVFQAIPAVPGSVTPLERNGKPLPQRPRQAGEEEAPAAPEGLPEGAIPPTGEAAPEEAPSE
jgi:parvulin-like peptidyl-prolyl isomerase